MSRIDLLGNIVTIGDWTGYLDEAITEGRVSDEMLAALDHDGPVPPGLMRMPRRRGRPRKSAPAGRRSRSRPS
jgi:hypothetical protein